MPRLTLFALLLALAGCGGMNRAVGVLPNTLDDLGQRTAPLRENRASNQPGDAALAARP